MANNFQTGLIITGDASGAIRATQLTEAALNRLNNSNRAGQSAWDRQRQSILDAQNALSRYTSFAGQALGAVTGALSAHKLMEYSDAWTNITSRLSLVTSSTNQLASAQSRLMSVSQDTRSAMQGTSDLYFKLAQSTESLYLSQDRLLSKTSTISKAIKLSGANEGQSSAAVMQFGQGLASNRLGGDEYKSISENAPRLIKAIADGMDVSIGKLRELSTQGKLTAETVLNALDKSAGKIDAEFSKLQPTIAGSFTLINNKIQEYVGVSSNANGISAGLAHSLKSVAENFDLIAQAAGVFAIASLPTLLLSIAGGLKAITAAAMANPLGAALTVAAGTAGMLYEDYTKRKADNAKKYDIAPTLAEQNKLINDQIELIADLADRGDSNYFGKLDAANNALDIMLANRSMLIDRLENENNELLKQKKIQEEKNALTREKISLDTQLDQILNGRYKQDIIAEAQRQGVDPKIALVVAQLETLSGELKKTGDTWVSPAGAMGLMQVMPDMAERIAGKLGLSAKAIKNEVGPNLAGGVYLIKDAINTLPPELQTLENVLAVFNTGLPNFKKAGFDMTRVSAETRKYMQDGADLYEKLAGMSKTNFFKDQADSLKQSQEEAYQYAQNGVKLADSLKLPVVEYNRSVKELRTRLSEGFITQEQFAFGLARANEALMGSAEHTQAYQTTLQITQKQYEDFNAVIQQGIVYQNAAKSSTQLYQEEIRKLVDVYNSAANAGNGLMSVDVFSKNLGQIQDKQNQPQIDVQNKALSEYDALIKQIESSTSKLGATNSAVFDSALGGINTLVGALQDMGEHFKAVGTAQQQLAMGSAYKNADIFNNKNLTESERSIKLLEEENRYTKANQALEDQKNQAALTGTRQIIGATANMFDQKSRAAKALHAIEQGIGAAQLAMNAAKMASDIATTGPAVASGVAQLFSQGGFAGFAAAGAFLALMAGLGFGGGGSGSTVDYAKLTQEKTGTGTVLGDSSAKSDSISKNIEYLKSNSDESLPISKAMLDSLRNINTGITNLTAYGAQQGWFNSKNVTNGISTGQMGGSFKDIGDTLATGFLLGGVGLIASLFGFDLFGRDKSVSDYGITSNVPRGDWEKDAMAPANRPANFIDRGQTIAEIMAGKLDLRSYTDTHVSDFWGSRDHREGTEKKMTSDALSMISKIIMQGADSIKQSAIMLDPALKSITGKVDDFVFKLGDISFKGTDGKDRSAEDIQKDLNAAFSKSFDEMAKTLVPGLEDFQNIGEGYYQTLIRVSNQIEVVQTNFKMVGVAFNATGMDAVKFSDDLVKAAGDIGTLRDQFKSFFSKFYSEGEQFGYQATVMTNAVNTLGLSLPSTREEWRLMVQNTLAAGDASASTSAQLLQLTDSADKYYKYLQDSTDLFIKLGEKLKGKEWGANMTKSLAEGLTQNAIDAFNTKAGTNFTRQTIKDIYNDNAKIVELDKFRINNPVLGGLAVDVWRAYDNEMSASINLTSIQTDSQDKLNKTLEESATKLKAVTEAQNSVNDRLKELASTDVQNGLDAIDKKIAALIKTATDNNGSLNNISQLRQSEYAKYVSDYSKPFAEFYQRMGNSDYQNTMLDIANKYDLATAAAKEFAQRGLINLLETLNVLSQSRAYEENQAALQRNNLVLSKQAEIYSAQGNTIAATNLQREIELSTMDKALVPMQRMIYLLQDQAKATNLLNTALDAYKNSSKEAITFIADFKKSISDWVASHETKDLGSPETQLKKAGDLGAIQLQKALAGDRKALGSITTYADNYLSAIDKYYGSSVLGQQKKTELMDIMKQLPDQLTVEQIMQDGFAQTVSALKDLPSQIANLQSHLTNDIAAMVMNLDINASIPQDVRDLAHLVGGQILFTVDAIAGVTLPDPIKKLAFENQQSIVSNINFLTSTTLDPAIITMGLNVAGELNKDVRFYALTPTLSNEVRTLGLAANSELIKQVNLIVDPKYGTEVHAMGLDLLGTAQKYTNLIINSDLDMPAKQLKLDQIGTFTKDAVLSLTTTGTLTPDQQSVVNAVKSQFTTGTQTLNQTVNTNGSQVGLTIAGGAYSNASPSINVNSVLTYGVDLANSMLAYNKADVAKVYGDINSNTYNTFLTLIDMRNWLTSLYNLLGTHLPNISEHTKWSANNVVAEASINAWGFSSMNGGRLPPSFGNYRQFAKGGIATEASIFGEAGPEAAVPLPDGRTIPVTLSYIQSANHAGDEETIAELRAQNAALAEQNKKLDAALQLLQEGFKQLIQQNKQQNEHLDNIERDNRLAA